MGARRLSAGLRALGAACVLLAAGAAPAQTIQVSALPPYGSLGLLEGSVSGADPASHHVAVYIQIEGSGWWTKPTFARPTVPIAPDGSFSADVTTGGLASLDPHATIFCAALLPAAVSPPPASGGVRIPASLAPLALDCQERYARTFAFAGFTWGVKESPLAVGPGGNVFSDRSADVFVDAAGLHLRADFHAGQWWSVEVMLLDELGYGTYGVQTESRLDELDAGTVFGIFTWDPYGDEEGVPGGPSRELDFEDSRWGDPADPQNAQWVVQPYTAPGNLARYTLPDLGGDPALTRLLGWSADAVGFVALRGLHSWCCSSAPDGILHTAYLHDPGSGRYVPSAGRARLRLNLWLVDGTAPAEGEAVEVVVRNVTYLPEPGAVWLQGSGLALLALLRRWRERSARRRRR